jgi:hypothetical protein
MNHIDPFQWECHPKAEQLVQEVLEKAVQLNPFIAHLQQTLLEKTSTRLFDWLDHIIISRSAKWEKAMENAGYISDHSTSSYRIFHHPGAQLPRIVVNDNENSEIGIAVSVGSIADFLMVRGCAGLIEGSLQSSYRRCCISTENEVSLWIIERRGVSTIEPIYNTDTYLTKYNAAMEKWQTRPRRLQDEDEALSRTLNIAEEIISMLGQDLAAWIVLECERKYWETRNTAGQIQKARQDKLGMGWENHDHHTFRSSRRHFHHLVRLFEMLGFHCRERYYAGSEAGWGAQIMENPKCKLVLFLDVDLDPNELIIDFAHHPLQDLKKLGTVGLWCGLHGDSILKGGMHHLEAQFMFEELREELKSVGIGMMDPFSSFPYLKQAFTIGEMWPVDPLKIQKLLKDGLITEEQANKFQSKGAIGSHMENLQRREGYKGFNKKNVSSIISKTDPRKISS